jgi:hypothetical protein
MPAMTLEREPHSPRARGILLLGVALVVGLAITWVTARELRPRFAARPEPPESIDTDRYLGPIETELEPGTGERVAPFSGFAISVETEPESALVSIAGVERGEAPVLAGFECRPGTRIPVHVHKRGFRAARTTTLCRIDALVKLTVRLSR